MDHCAVRIFCVFSRLVPPTKDEVFPTVTAAVVLWNTVYLERAAHALRGNGHAIDDALLPYSSPLSWEHIHLTGDYLWRSSAKIGSGKFRPLRPLQPA
jgi:Transposase.